jgi:hypothetical protein
LGFASQVSDDDSVFNAFVLVVLPDHAQYFMLGAHDDTAGVLANMGVVRPSRWQL